jgi:uncharacterized protein YggE
MTRRTWMVALVVVGLLVVALGARAMADDPDDGEGGRSISVTSTATVGSEPDQATLRLGIETSAEDSADVLAALTAAGIDADDVQTERLDVNRRTIDRRTPQERTVFVADTTLGVTVRDLDSVGPVIEAAVGAGATSVRDVRFEVADPSQARTKALEQAVDGARAKADAMAAAAGTSVTGVERIVEEGAARPVYEQYRAATLGAAAADASFSVVPPDELDTSVTITVVWTIG